MKNLIKKLLAWIGTPPLPEPMRMSDAQLYGALAVDREHPVFCAMLEIAQRACQDAKEQARNSVADHAECSYYLGAEWALESLIEYAHQARLEAERRAAALQGFQNDA